MEAVKLLANPVLRDTLAVIGFNGWANAGEVSTAVAALLHQVLEAKPLAEIEPDEFFVFTENRPTAQIKDGRLLSLTEPRGVFAYAAPENGRSVLIFQGDEPQLKWREYVRTMLAVLTRFQTRLVVTVGGTYDERLHTDPPLVSLVGQDLVLMEAMMAQAAGLSEYSGPVSIHTFIHRACREVGLPVVSLWGHAPVYVQTGNFHLIRKIVKMISGLGLPPLDLTCLDTACQEMNSRIEALIHRSEKLAGYVEKLKQAPGGAAAPLSPCLSKGRAKIIPLNRKNGEGEDD